MIDVKNTGDIYHLSADEQQWIKLDKAKISQPLVGIATAALNGKIYFTGGYKK